MKQEKEARNQTEIANAISRFKTNMLTAADPTHSLGDKVTVLDMMNVSKEQIDDGEFKDKPAVEAKLRSAIGLTLLSLGRYETKRGRNSKVRWIFVASSCLKNTPTSPKRC